MSRPKRVNEINLRKAIEGSYGNLTVIRQRLGCSRQTLWLALKEFDFEKLLEQEREKLLDNAEYVVAQSIIEHKNVKTAMWYLERKGRARGYNPELTTPPEERTDNTLNVIFTERKAGEETGENKKEDTSEA